jgi:hypothetical protein
MAEGHFARSYQTGAYLQRLAVRPAKTDVRPGGALPKVVLGMQGTGRTL